MKQISVLPILEKAKSIEQALENERKELNEMHWRIEWAKLRVEVQQILQNDNSKGLRRPLTVGPGSVRF
jgi:hypothetical protein